jgi:hypothetical protein
MPDPKGKEAICCIRQHGLKHRLQLPRRPRYDLQHLRRRRLLLQRLGELARALLLCLKQPHVLDSDHRRPEKRNLLIGKRINFGTSKLNCARNAAGISTSPIIGFFLLWEGDPPKGIYGGAFRTRFAGRRGRVTATGRRPRQQQKSSNKLVERVQEVRVSIPRPRFMNSLSL